MSNIFHLNRWKLQKKTWCEWMKGNRRKRGRKRQMIEGGVHACLCVCCCVCGTDQKYVYSNYYTVVNTETCAQSSLLMVWRLLTEWLQQLQIHIASALGLTVWKHTTKWLQFFFFPFFYILPPSSRFTLKVLLTFMVHMHCLHVLDYFNGHQGNTVLTNKIKKKHILSIKHITT